MTKPGDIDGFLRIAEQLERERTAARDPIKQLVLSIDDSWEREIPAAWQTLGFVTELAATSLGILEQDPRAAVGLAQLGLVVLGLLRDDQYPSPLLPQAYGETWKALATAHRYRSEYPAALRALDAGDRAIEDCAVLGHDRACLRLTRAVVLRELGVLDTAMALLNESAADFDDYGDNRRLGQCFLLRGMIEYSRGEYARACATYEEARRYIEGTDDRHSLAAIYNNLGWARSELGQVDEAVEALQKARALLSDLGQTGDAVRADWALGRLLLSKGDFTRAHVRLEKVRERFLAFTMPEEAGLAGLDIVEGHIALNETGHAKTLIETIIGEFQRAGLNDRAATALAYLREVLNA